jgi:hypothetical protein
MWKCMLSVEAHTKEVGEGYSDSRHYSLYAADPNRVISGWNGNNERPHPHYTLAEGEGELGP